MDAVDVSKLSDAERFALAKQLASDIRGSLPNELYAGSFTLRSKLPYKATSFREVLIHRISDIADAAIDLYEKDRLVPAFIETRAVVETTAMVYWLYGNFILSSNFGHHFPTIKFEKCRIGHVYFR